MKLLFLVSMSLLMAGSAVQAKPGDLKWTDAPPSLPKGAKMAVVSGDPGNEGKFAIQLQLPTDYLVPAHSHPSDEVVKVVSGEIHYGMSDKSGENAKTLTTGKSVTMGAKMNHWVHSAAPATIQVSGTGPFQSTYADPKDDPRSKK